MPVGTEAPQSEALQLQLRLKLLLLQQKPLQQNKIRILRMTPAWKNKRKVDTEKVSAFFVLMKYLFTFVSNLCNLINKLKSK